MDEKREAKVRAVLDDRKKDMAGWSNLEGLIERLPKTDLHLHLDGSIKLERMIEIAQAEKIKLPSYTVDGLNEVLFKENYKNLEEYLTTFGYSCAVMQKPEYLEQIAYDLAVANQKEGVRYIEVRFAPHLHINPLMDMEAVLTSVHKGLEKAEKEFNSRPEVKNGKEPSFHSGIVVCALRSFGKFSQYYNMFIESHPFSNPKKIFGLCSLELVQGAVKYRDENGLSIVGFDLAGAEEGFPAVDHRDAYRFAHANFMHKTVHAGEAYGPESIFQAITELYAERIGHGYYLFDTDKISDPSIADKNRYVESLAQYIAERRITIEVCLTSNMQTNPAIGNIENHSFKKMLDRGLSTTFCTDNRTVSKTTVSNEIVKAINAFGMSPRILKHTLIYGFKRSFYAGSYAEKRRYVRSIIDYFDEVLADYID